jgi:hypothetical protein
MSGSQTSRPSWRLCKAQSVCLTLKFDLETKVKHESMGKLQVEITTIPWQLNYRLDVSRATNRYVICNTSKIKCTLAICELQFCNWLPLTHSLNTSFSFWVRSSINSTCDGFVCLVIHLSVCLSVCLCVESPKISLLLVRSSPVISAAATPAGKQTFKP